MQRYGKQRYAKAKHQHKQRRYAMQKKEVYENNRDPPIKIHAHNIKNQYYCSSFLFVKNKMQSRTELEK